MTLSITNFYAQITTTPQLASYQPDKAQDVDSMAPGPLNTLPEKAAPSTDINEPEVAKSMPNSPDEVTGPPDEVNASGPPQPDVTWEIDPITSSGDVGADSEDVDDSALPKAPTIGQAQDGLRRGRGHGRGRSGSSRGIRGGCKSVGKGVKRKAGSDLSRPKEKKPRNVLPPPPPREMSKRCAFHSLIYMSSPFLIVVLHSIHGEAYANSLVKIREPRK
jgi:hypothetical protein